jgi:hypothetical protein
VVSNGFDRQVGALIGPVITLVHTNIVDRTDLTLHEQVFIDDTLASEANSSSIYRLDRDDQQVRAGVQAVIEQPLGLLWHLSIASNATSDVSSAGSRSPDPVRSEPAVLAGRAVGMRYGRVEQYRRTGSETQNAYQLWSVTYGATLNFYLEDHVSLGLSAIGTQQRQRLLRAGHGVRPRCADPTGDLVPPRLADGAGIDGAREDPRRDRCFTGAPARRERDGSHAAAIAVRVDSRSRAAQRGAGRAPVTRGRSRDRFIGCLRSAESGASMVPGPRASARPP